MADLQSLRVLILEDNPSDAELMVDELRQAGFDPIWKRVDNETDFLARLDPAPDIILADYSLPECDAPRALRALQERGLEIPFIMVSGTVSEEVAVECINRARPTTCSKTGWRGWERRCGGRWRISGCGSKNSGRTRRCANRRCATGGCLKRRRMAS